jgi:hypothetical protein
MELAANCFYGLSFLLAVLELEVLLPEVKLSLGLINYVPRHEDVWGSSGISPPFFTLALD